jgi:cytochrome c biogenesis protein CcdA
MKKFLIILILAALQIPAFAQTCIYYFHGAGCIHCAKIDPIISNLTSNVKIVNFEIYNNRTNAEILSNFFDLYNVSSNDRGIPIIFFKNSYLSGNLDITNNINSEIAANDGLSCPEIKLSTNKEFELSLPMILTIIGAGLADSINPCAIAVLLIMLGSLITLSKNKATAVKAGFAFIISIYIAYFLFGLGLLSFIKITGFSGIIYSLMGVLAVIIGLFNIKDYFWYGGAGFAMEIPRRWRPKLKQLLSSVTSPLSAFLIGFLVCLFELPCTGGPYLFIIGLLADKAATLAAVPVLLFYNIFFVLPLVIINLLVYYYGKNAIGKSTKWKEKNIKNLHLITGIVLTLIGTLIIFKII